MLATALNQAQPDAPLLPTQEALESLYASILGNPLDRITREESDAHDDYPTSFEVYTCQNYPCR